MRKVLIAILVVALFSSFLVFADESNFLDLFDSVQFSTGFDMFMAQGKITKSEDLKDNNKFGFGIGLSTTLDLSAIPYFPSDDWRAYVGYDLFFSGNQTLYGYKVPGKEATGSLGMKLHIGGLYHTTFGTPLDFYFGGGLAWNRISAKLSSQLSDFKSGDTISASSWGISLYAESSYEFYRHFATFVTVIPDITFLTRLQSKGKPDGASVVVYKTSFGFGFDLSIKTGIKYVF